MKKYIHISYLLQPHIIPYCFFHKKTKDTCYNDYSVMFVNCGVYFIFVKKEKQIGKRIKMLHMTSVSQNQT